MFVPPPFLKLAPVEPKIQQRRAGSGDLLPDRIFEFRFVDKRWSSTKRLKCRPPETLSLNPSRARPAVTGKLT